MEEDKDDYSTASICDAGCTRERVESRHDDDGESSDSSKEPSSSSSEAETDDSDYRDDASAANDDDDRIVHDPESVVDDGPDDDDDGSDDVCVPMDPCEANTSEAVDRCMLGDCGGSGKDGSVSDGGGSGVGGFAGSCAGGGVGGAGIGGGAGAAGPVVPHGAVVVAADDKELRKWKSFIHNFGGLKDVKDINWR